MNFSPQPDGDKPIRNFLDDPRRSGPAPDIDRKEGSRRHVRNWGGLDFDNVKTGSELEREWTVSDNDSLNTCLLEQMLNPVCHICVFRVGGPVRKVRWT